MRLRLASYNIHRCIGRDGRRDPARTLRVVRELDADVIALQEVEIRPDGEGTADFLSRLEAETGMTALAGPTLFNPDHQYGNALLTRLPIAAVRRIDLSQPGREPRGALDVDLEMGDLRMQVVATHLGLAPFERRAQILALLRHLDPDCTHPVALMGDLNEWFSWGRPLRRLHGHFGRPPAPRSFPVGLPLFRLDRIWFRPRAWLRSVRTHRSTAARIASDHLPVTATIEREE